MRRTSDGRTAARFALRFAWRFGAAATAVISLLGVAAAAEAQTEAAAPPSRLSISELEIEPGQPGPDTLCRLRVTLSNAGERDAAGLAFTVRINGKELAVYRNQLFMQSIPAGKSEIVALYNFWTTETSRPMPDDGRLRLEVVLREAQWMQIGDDEEGVEVWQPLGAVEGLPVTVERTIELRRTPAEAG